MAKQKNQSSSGVRVTRKFIKQLEKLIDLAENGPKKRQAPGTSRQSQGAKVVRQFLKDAGIPINRYRVTSDRGFMHWGVSVHLYNCGEISWNNKLDLSELLGAAMTAMNIKNVSLNLQYWSFGDMKKAIEYAIKEEDYEEAEYWRKLIEKTK